jgi:hypothetical protein
LSFTAAKWARSIWWAASLVLSGCAATPPPAPAPPPPAPAPAVATPPPEPADLVVWEGDDATEISCPFTETDVEVPQSWRADVKQISPTEVVWQPADERRVALLVRGSSHRMTTRDGLEDMKRLLELVGMRLPMDAPDSAQLAADLSNEEILPSIDFIDLNSTPVEIDQEPPETGTVVFGYRVVVRDDATCRLATAALKSDSRVPLLSELLEAVHTAPPTDPTSLSFVRPPAVPKIPPATCKGWPVWMLPSCRPASLPPPHAKKKP